MGAVVVLGTATGGVLWMDDRHAHSKAITIAQQQTKATMLQIQTAITKTNQRITQNRIQDRITGITQQLWNIENRCNTQDPIAMPPGERERYRQLTVERTRLERELEAMNK
jgi:hypothetical protein